MSMYDMVDTTPEGYSEGEELSKMFSEDDMSEAFEERDIDVITEEINFYKQQAGMAILEIGKRLVEAKAQLSHGEWLPWLEKKVEFSERSAQQYIRLWKEYGKSATVADLGVRKALVLLALPDTERDSFAGEKHEVNGEEKTAAEMTVKELEKAVAERNTARQEAEQAKADLYAAREAAREARDHVEALRRELEALKNRPTEQLAAARQEAEAAAARRVAELEKALEQARGAAAAAEDRKETAEAALQDAERERDSALDAAKGYKAEAEAAHKLAAAASNEGMTKFKVVFDQTVENVNTLAALLQALPDSQQEKLRRALLALADQVRKVGA